MRTPSTSCSISSQYLREIVGVGECDGVYVLAGGGKSSYSMLVRTCRSFAEKARKKVAPRVVGWLVGWLAPRVRERHSWPRWSFVGPSLQRGREDPNRSIYVGVACPCRIRNSFYCTVRYARKAWHGKSSSIVHNLQRNKTVQVRRSQVLYSSK